MVLYLVGIFINIILSWMYYDRIFNGIFSMLYILQIVSYVLIGLIAGEGKDRMNGEKKVLRILAVVIVILLMLPLFLWDVNIHPLISLAL